MDIQIDVEIALARLFDSIDFLETKFNEANMNNDITDFAFQQLKSNANFLNNYYDEIIKREV